MRDIDIFDNLQRVGEPGDRIVVIMGSGHAPILRELVTSDPEMVLVDTLEYLPSDPMRSVVLDTNVFVGAGFNASSASREIVRRVEAGDLRLIWCDATRRETERIVGKIPPLEESRLAGLFRSADRHGGELEPQRYPWVAGAMDRTFLALAEAAGVPLVTSDSDLLDHRERARVSVLTPGEYLRRQGSR